MKTSMDKRIMIGWTTVSSVEDANKLVRELLSLKIIACGQINGPITSFYIWDANIVEESEWRIMLKFPKDLIEDVYNNIIRLHPYRIPQWVCCEVDAGNEFKEWVLTTAS